MDGSLIATSCKDKKIRVIDPRKNEVITVSVACMCTSLTEHGMTTWNVHYINYTVE